MCEAPICRCHCTPEKPTLKIEVGKTYLTRNNTKIKVLFLNQRRYVGQAQDTKKYYEFSVDGTTCNVSICTDLVSEYKEPEYWYINVHKDGSVNQMPVTHAKQSISYMFTIRINKETKAIEKLS
jgi:hypothetical protein